MMKPARLAVVLSVILPLAAVAENIGGIRDAAVLAPALARATAGDTLTLDADVQWNGPKPIAIPAGVALDGAGHTLKNTAKGGLLNQVGAAKVVIRNLKLTTDQYTAWTIGVKDGDLRFDGCEIRCRLIAWEMGAITLDNCQVTVQLPNGNDNSGPVGAYGSGASFTATNCLFKFGWDTVHVGAGFLHNFGGQPASRLTIAKCTVIGGPDTNYAQGGRHLTVFQSGNEAGPDYETTVTDSIILAEVKSVFRSSGKGKVTSSHNNNAGMLRNPGILADGDPLYPSFYGRSPDGTPVQDKSGDIEEPNPFIDAANGDYRVLANSQSAVGAGDGGPLGIKLPLVVRDINAYNLAFDRYVDVGHRTKGYREALFDGWPVRRETDQQRCCMTPDGVQGPAIRLETWRNDEGTGGPGKMVSQDAFQSFAALPGWKYVIRASARRSHLPLTGTWEDNGTHAHAVLGVADGYSPEPDKLIASLTIDGPQDTWCKGEVQIIAPSNRLTVHLIHRTDGDWNRVDWDQVSIVAHAPIGVKIPAGLRGPVLGYINSVPPESDAARAARHKKVAERRANIPVLVHRGSHKFDPENTLEAYDRCVALGADGIEFDPRMTKDGVTYTYHDPEFSRMLTRGPKGREITYYELLCIPFKNIKGNATKQTRVPTMASVLQLSRERAMLLHFDIKEPGLEDLMIGLLDRFDMWDHMVFVTPSPDSDRLRHHPKAKLLEYKQHVDATSQEGFKKSLDGPGQMYFTDADPSPVLKCLGRKPIGDRPLPDSVRAWWWPDGTCEPLPSPDQPKK